MHQPGPGQPAVAQSSGPFRAQLAFLTAPFQHVPPVASQPLPETEPARPVARYRVVLVETVQHTRLSLSPFHRSVPSGFSAISIAPCRFSISQIPNGPPERKMRMV